MRYITAEYNASGYEVTVYDQRPNKPVRSVYRYSAGNCQFDSGVVLPHGDLYAIPLRSIRSMCIKTAKGIAKGYNAKFNGVERIEDNEE